MTRAAPHALMLVPIWPSLTGNGLAMRLAMFAEALSRVASIEMICVPVFGGPGDDAWVRERSIARHLVDPSGREDTHYRLLARLGDPAARLAAFRAYGRTSLEARLSRPVVEEVADLADGRLDLVHVARGYLAGAGIAAGREATLTVDLDEDDAWSFRSLGRIGKSPDNAGWAMAEAAATDRSLGAQHARFSALFVSGPADGRRLSRRHPGLQPVVVPNPSPVASAPPRADDGHTLLFVGSFGYAPNIDGLEWFLSDIFPAVRQAVPATRLRIAGRDLPERFVLRDGTDGIEIIGAVDDLRPAYGAATLAVAPLRAGGGTRIKLIEAAAWGTPIVATPIAARGLSFGTDRGMWIAAEPEAVAAAIVDALHRPAERAARAAVALALASKHHARAAIVEGLACRFEELMAR